MRTLGAFFRNAVFLIGLWQVVVWLFTPPRYILPAPQAVAEAFLSRPSFLATHALITLSEILAGFAAGTMLGVITAIGVTALPKVERLVWPAVVMLQSFPVFVIAPLLVLWFGFGMASKVVMTTIIIFFPVASAFADGLRNIHQDILDAAALTEANRWQALRHIRIPLALPALFSGLRVAAPLAPLGAVVGEWVGASAGLGYVMVEANARMQTGTVFAAMAILAAEAIFLRAAVNRAAPFFIRWAPAA
ncbi:ABC transporter permease [Rhizobiaceae bacterium BDR2-2]|uniref:ABC transporter permease n=1 Tax=Ectorhizobium quercum TaxID=2965071 RepID=A0AAE3SUQ7_9HYPH|nr:ABC transporter permease [Ectorhizobium quercum]MCX8996953.1 ABC transporter permease [Ectorhizobium quercum]